MPTDLEKRMLAAVTDSYERYKEAGPRSNKKLFPLHGWVCEEIQLVLGDGYVIRSVQSGGERNIDGKYYSKNVDVSVEFNGHVVGVVNVKFVMSNYRQNANNYFENQLGETANLRRSNIAYGHLNLFTHPIPYFNREGELETEQHLNDADIKKYSLLSEDHTYPHAPNVQAICIFYVEGLAEKQTGRIAGLCEPEDATFLSPESRAKLRELFGADRFFTVFCKEVEAKTAAHRA